jgi:hypothetical protein
MVKILFIMKLSSIICFIFLIYRLYFSLNNIGDIGIEYLSKGLMNLHNLKSLNLHLG